MRLHNLFVCCLMMLFIQPVQSQDYAGSSNEPGNITSLTCNGLQDSGTYSLMDALTLSYDGNQLTGVSETAADYDFSGLFEYKKSKGPQYIYNNNGSLVADKSRGIAYITYDYNNNPQTIYFTNGYMTKYTYSTLGDKLSVEHFVAQPNVTWAFGVQPDVSQSQPIFAGHTDYLVGGSLIVKENIIKRLFFDGGYVDAAVLSSPTTYGFTPYYYNKDHLGNNREVVNRSNNVQQLTNYYPFGAPYADPAAVIGSSVQPYKYNGKELDVMHGLNTYDYGARQYYPVVGRWDRMDPLCEKYYDVSPYAYCMNNPIGNIDPDGRSVWTKGIKIALKVGVRVSRNGWKELGKAANYADAVSDITDNVKTLFDSNASTAKRIGAGLSLASEVLLPVSVGDFKDAKKFVSPKNSRTARREVMRKQGIPTSQQPISQSKNASGREYSYETFNKEGKSVVKSVQQQTRDISHPHEKHWEAGEVKTDEYGNIEKNRYERPKLKNGKDKEYYE